AWSFLLSPVSAAVADLPLALFVFGSPLAPLSLLLPLAACVALTVITGVSFDRERLMETGLGRSRERRHWFPAAIVRRRAAALGAGLLLAVLPAAGGAAYSAAAGLHSWGQVQAVVSGHQGTEASAPPARTAPRPAAGARTGVTVAAAAMAGLTGGLSLALVLLVVSFAAFFLLGLPELILLAGAAALWGVQAGFGPGAPLAGWLGLAGGVVVLALALNTAASLPIYSALMFGAGRRLDRMRLAWGEYFSLYRGLVLPCCAAFGLVVLLLLLAP
ncbi:MAG: hypothetical protein M3024_09455, partial [Candidatus Dormibacteraeota bacterium]|nr:hypothetical protein [Candidatus Dormibacteraeota bacterium]